MPQHLNDRQVFSLLEVTRSIQKTLEQRYTSLYWIKAEMNKLNFYRQSGHCYPELLEKREGRTVAQIRAFLHRDDFFRINRAFQQILKEPLKDGIKILFQAKVTFDPVHGLSLWIADIDPGYTLGDLEREKKETIGRLTNEGIFNRNKGLTLPLLPQRIAIISVQSSKGYADFLSVIDAQPSVYRFFHMLFPSLLQGDNAVASLMGQLDRIRKVQQHFDVVAIIRGGGGDVGLSCYNNYELAREIALFPIPVLTGIGHATNETVAEAISFYNAITPTKLAEFLIQKFRDFSLPLQDAQRSITERAKRLVIEEAARLQSEVKLFRSVTENVLADNRNEVRMVSRSLQHQSAYIFRNRTDLLRTKQSNLKRAAGMIYRQSGRDLRSAAMLLQRVGTAQLAMRNWRLSQLSLALSSNSHQKLKSSRLELHNLEKNVSNMHPSNVLKRGYSITTSNGQAVTHVEQLKAGDTLKTYVWDGEITSTVIFTNQANDHE